MNIQEVLEQCEEVLEYASDVFNDSRFADRHGMGPEFARVLGMVREHLDEIEAGRKSHD